jgi:hypothetical protein
MVHQPRLEIVRPRTVRSSIEEESHQYWRLVRRVFGRWYINAAIMLTSYLLMSNNAIGGGPMKIALCTIGFIGLMYSALRFVARFARHTRASYVGFAPIQPHGW